MSEKKTAAAPGAGETEKVRTDFQELADRIGRLERGYRIFVADLEEVAHEDHGSSYGFWLAMCLLYFAAGLYLGYHQWGPPSRQGKRRE